jgi:hypothetical protein
LARIAIQAKGWPGEMWPSILHVYAVLDDLEDLHAPDYATDIENYGFWRHSLATTGPVIGGAIEVEVELDPVVSGSGGGVISFPGVAGYHYLVKQSGGLMGDWKEIGRYRIKDEKVMEEFRHEVELVGKSGFWKIDLIRIEDR